MKKSKRILKETDNETDTSENNDKIEKLKLFQQMQMQFMEASGIEAPAIQEDESESEGSDRGDSEEEEELDEDLELSNFSDEDLESEESNDGDNKGGPEVIKFKDISITKNYQTGKSRFLSKKINKMEESKINKAKPNKKLEDEERQDLRNDLELNELLNDSGIIKQFVGSQLVGKEKRKFQKEQLKGLGMKNGKNAKIPKNIRMRVRSDVFRKAEEEVTKAKETGMYHKSIRSQFKHNQLKAQNQKSSDRGLQVQIGRERNGVLHIHKRDIEAATQKPKRFKSGGKGGSGGGPAFKPNTKFKKGGDRTSKMDRMLNKFKF